MKSFFLLSLIFVFLLCSCSTKNIVQKTPLKQTENTTPIAPTIQTESIQMVDLLKLVPEKSAGQISYENNCANCHQLYATTSYTKEEWFPILERMQRAANLNNQEIDLIREYIFKNAKQK